MLGRERQRGQAMEPKMNMGNSLVSVFQRIGRGVLGSWCIFGPILLIFGYSELPSGALVMAAMFVLIFYAIAVWKWRRQGLGFIKAVGKDTFLAFLFVAVGSAISGVVAAFGGPALHRTGGLMLISPLLGFWILEARARAKKADR